MKRTDRLHTTEADALRFLHGTGLNLPIPRLLDSFVHQGATYTIMSRLPGVPLVDVFDDFDEEQQKTICAEVKDVLRQLWKLRQPAEIAGCVLMSASGWQGDLPAPWTFFQDRTLPQPSILDGYAHVSSRSSVQELEEDAKERGVDLSVFTADDIVWVHPDLRTYNVIVDGGHLSGIIDWEDSGWYPRVWQLHALRWLSRFARGWWLDYWHHVTDFPENSEKAYKESFRILYYPIV